MLLTPIHANAQQETVLYSFNSRGSGGDFPYGGLIFDSAGNLYGTTFDGGRSGCGGNGCGVVFELTPLSGGGWSEKPLHIFSDTGTDGVQPVASLIFDGFGNLYGTTRYGGSSSCGTVFELIPQTNGAWSEKILHSFSSNGIDGCTLYAGVIFDAAGNLYGTTTGGGTYGFGTAFELSPGATGHWREKLLHTFGGATDGWSPEGGLVMDSVGNLYGTTVFGGNRTLNESGTVFELLPQAGGAWKERILANLQPSGSFPQNPYAGLIFDSAGNLYGTSYSGGKGARGTVFELSPTSGGSWTAKILHSFDAVAGDGQLPIAGVVMDSAGNLYGTTSNGGPSNSSQGIVYKLTPTTSGYWAETILYSFSLDSPFGQNPYSGLILDSSGNLFGTTTYGGSSLSGTVYEITP